MVFRVRKVFRGGNIKEYCGGEGSQLDGIGDRKEGLGFCLGIDIY